LAELDSSGGEPYTFNADGREKIVSMAGEKGGEGTFLKTERTAAQGGSISTYLEGDEAYCRSVAISRI